MSRVYTPNSVALYLARAEPNKSTATGQGADLVHTDHLSCTKQHLCPSNLFAQMRPTNPNEFRTYGCALKVSIHDTTEAAFVKTTR